MSVCDNFTHSVVEIVSNEKNTQVGKCLPVTGNLLT